MKGITICTGPSGVKVRECLGRLNGTLDTPRPIASVEKTISSVAGMELIEFLGLPSPILREHWRRGATQVIGEAVESPSPVFLTFHAAYYHQRTRGFIPAVELDVLQPLRGKVDKVLVFIDDVYDVYLRLLATGEMYEDVLAQEPHAALLSSIFNLIILLYWREIEIALSSAIGHYVGARMYIVATKHPCCVAKRLVENESNDLRIYYLSHPITTIRKEAESQFPSFVGRLATVIDALLSQDDTVLFIPTTIDELAMKRAKRGEGDVFLPELSQRWSHQDQSLMFPSLPDETSSLNPLNPCSYELSEGTGSDVSYLLNHLWLQIYRQTVSRDYSMVDQAHSGIIAVRPLYEGHFADGVMNEIKYNLRLMGSEPNRAAFIFTCANDAQKYAVSRLFTDLRLGLSAPPRDLGQKQQTWLRDAEKMCRLNFTDFISRLEREVLPRGYAFLPKVLSSSSMWSGELVKKSERRKQWLKTAWERMQRDEVIQALAEERLDGLTRVSCETFEEQTFWSKMLEYLNNKMYHTRRLL